MSTYGRADTQPSRVLIMGAVRWTCWVRGELKPHRSHFPANPSLSPRPPTSGRQ
jgi:hypothetical protein